MEQDFQNATAGNMEARVGTLETKVRRLEQSIAPPDISDNDYDTTREIESDKADTSWTLTNTLEMSATIFGLVMGFFYAREEGWHLVWQLLTAPACALVCFILFRIKAMM